MPNVYKMNPDKTLSMSQQSTNFVGEYNAEPFKVILPKIYNNINISKCVVLLVFKDYAKYPIRLDNPSDYCDDYLSYETHINNPAIVNTSGKKNFFIDINDFNPKERIRIITKDSYIEFIDKE